MKHVLQRADCRVEVNSLGAELQSLMVDGRERLWNADPVWWPRHSPVLFPTIGKSRDNEIQLEGVVYPISQHGFARDQEFALDEKLSTENSLCFRLFDTGETLQAFPFPFELSIQYTLQARGVHVRYEVFNPGNRTLPFALGAHPGFMMPASGFNGLKLVFPEEESFERHLLKEGIFNGETEDLGKGKELNLNSSLFDKDAIVLKNIQNRKLELSGPEGYQLEIQFGGFCDLGIWTKAGCEDFLCVEPWYGHADSLSGPTDLSVRDGIHLLEPGKTWEGFWMVMFP